MIDRFLSDPDGLALLLIVGLIGLALLVGALFIERLVEPRHEREFDHMSRVSRGRRAQASGYAPPSVSRQNFTPSAGWLADR